MVRRGEQPAKVFIVDEGAIELVHRENPRQVAVQVIGRGGVFGDGPFFAHSLVPFDAVAVEDSRLFTLSCLDLVASLRSDPLLVQRVLASLGARLMALHERLAEVLIGETEDRVALFLLHHPELSLSQAKLAELVGVHRSSVNRVLRQFEAAGLVAVGYRHVEVRDRDGLAALIGYRPLREPLGPLGSPIRGAA